MKKNYVRALFSFVIAGMMALSMFNAGTKTVVNADDTTSNFYTVQDTDDGSSIEKVIDGTTKNAAGNVYDGIIFAASKSYTYSSQFKLNRKFSVQIASGVETKLNHGFNLSSGANLTVLGEGKLIIDGGSGANVYGFFTSVGNVHVTLNQTNVVIQNTTQYGIYLQGEAANKDFTVNGGNLTVQKCGYPSAEGGILVDNGVFTITNGATVLAQENGNTLYGDYAMGAGTMNLNNNSVFNIITAKSGNVKNAISSSAATLNIDHATLNITQQRKGGTWFSASRGIYGDGTGAVNITNYGVVNIAATTDDAKNALLSYGIAGKASVNVDKTSTLNITGFGVAVGSPLRVEDDSLVTLNGGDKDITATSTIDSGSVKMQPATSVVNGVATSTGANKVDVTPVNASGEELTRFDLANFTGPVSVGAGSTTPAYEYVVGANHNGTAYVWAPAVTITFLKNDKETVNTVKETIRGNSLKFVNGTEATPEDISGYDFIGWKYKDTDTTYTTDLNVNENITVVPVYEPKNGITADSYTGDYDGAEHTITNVKADLADSELSYSLVNPEQAADSDWTEKAPVFKNAGTYTVYVRAMNENSKTYTKSFTVTINKKALTLTSGSASGPYSGRPLTNSTVTADGFVTGEGAVYTVTGSQTAIGTSSNTFTYTMNAGTSAGNYSITPVYGTLEVTRATTPGTNTNPSRTSTPTTNGRASTPLTGDQTNAPLAAGIMGGALLLGLLAFLARKKYCK